MNFLFVLIDIRCHFRHSPPLSRDMDSMAKYLMCKWKKNKVGKDPDEVWSNLYREKEKNSMYRWVAGRDDILE